MSKRVTLTDTEVKVLLEFIYREARSAGRWNDISARFGAAALETLAAKLSPRDTQKDNK